MLPDADLMAGEMESLPFGDDAFDIVTGFNAFQFAADPAHALREAGRVSAPGAPIVIATWGRPEQCEAAAYVKAVGGLLPPPPPGAPGPFALSEPGAIEAFAAKGGLIPGERREVLCVWDYADEASLLRAFRSTGFAVKAIEHGRRGTGHRGGAGGRCAVSHERRRIPARERVQLSGRPYGGREGGLR